MNTADFMGKSESMDCKLEELVQVLKNNVCAFPHRSMILSRRPNDDDRHDGFVKWPFMTTHTWGENPRGTWTLEVSSNPFFASTHI